MKIGVVGLGNMGSAIAKKLLGSFPLYVYDISPDARSLFAQRYPYIHAVNSLQELSVYADCIWLMIPTHAVEEVFQSLLVFAQSSKLIIDGGNSHFVESVRRYVISKEKGHQFLDCGVSGGLEGARNGFCLMIGGDREVYTDAEPIFKILARDEKAYAYIGPSGAGHYVKMVHNGIEYGIMQAYADGFNLLRHGRYSNLDLAQISELWMHGAVVRSWLLSLAAQIFAQDQIFEHISGEIEETGMGRWTVDEAHFQRIPVPVIETALKVRDESRRTRGDYGTKLVALMRNKMGGHKVKKIEMED